jgi:hypothetical protein
MSQSTANRSHPVTPCFRLLCSEKRAFSPLSDQPPVNVFSSSVSFSVGYGLFPPLLDLRSFLHKTGIFFYVSGTLDWITGEITSDCESNNSVFAASFANFAFGHGRSRRRFIQ